MSDDIPDDIMAVGLKMADEYADWVEHGNTSATLSGHAIEAIADTIARAIMAERERCARVADTYFMRWENDGSAYWLERRMHSEEIATAIRKGTP